MEQPVTSAKPLSKPPTVVLALIAIWALVELLEIIDSRGPVMWPDQPPPGFAYAVADILQYLYAYLFIAVIGYGLIKGLLFIWAAALVWQAIEAGLGLVNLTLNDYQLDAYRHLSGVPFYGILLPLTVAVLSFVLLLLPSTRSWISSH